MDDFQALQFQEVKEQIAGFCRFSLGKALIREVVPSYEALWIKRENERAKEALALFTAYGNIPLPGLYDISQALQDALRDQTLRPMELYQIAQQGQGIKGVWQYMNASELKSVQLDDLCHAFQDVSALCQAITRCIQNGEEVIDNASSQLAQLRKSIRACESDIARETQQFIAGNHTKLMDTISVSRGGRVCVLIKASEKNSVKGFVHGESASGQAVYMEPEMLLQLNNKLASLQSREQEEVERILRELSQMVKRDAHALGANQETFALLDAYFAKAAYARKHDACIAEIVPNGDHLYLKEARHPLIDPKRCVANTYEIKAPYRSILITGSNTGGKTVTLKTIGLAACMAQSGLPVLSQTALLPLFSHIFADIGDDQSIQESLSTFSAHVSKLSYILTHVDQHSLVLLDELGSGTDPKEGESLAVAVLDDLREQKAFVLATTHYSALKNYAKKQDDVLISSVAFDVETMKPTYRYLEGISGVSNAFAIAARYHMKESVLTQAERIKAMQTTKQDEYLEKLERELSEAMNERIELEKEREEVRLLKEDLQRREAQLERDKQRQLAEFKEAYAQKMETMMEEGETIIAQLKAMDHDVKPHVVEAAAYRLRSLDQAEEPESQSKPQELAIGDRVAIAQMNAHGEIIEMQKDKVIVSVNGVRMTTKKSDLTRIAPQAKKQVKERGYALKRKSTHFSMELNVIGMQVAEALPVIDKYLDNAILAKLSTVRIIHGNGTGALRKGVHQYLKRDSKVMEFRLGGQGEGGTGATVVTLKKRGKHHG